MTDQERKAMQMALLTLEGWSNHGEWVWPESALEQSKRNTKEAIEALRTALAQPEQRKTTRDEKIVRPEIYEVPVKQENLCVVCGKPTMHMGNKCYGCCQTAQPEQEPVAWQFYQGSNWHIGMNSHDHRKNTEADGYKVRDLYTAPPKREFVGLTDKEREAIILESYSKYNDGDPDFIAAAIEAKLKEINT